MSTTIGLIGLGKMGYGLARRLRGAGIRVIATDREASLMEAARAELGVDITATVEDLLDALPERSVVWLMLPSGDITRAMVDRVGRSLSRPLIVVDGGNSNFGDAARHAEIVASAGGDFVDVGVSGGQWGWKEGYGLMVGASLAVYDQMKDVLDALSGASSHYRVGECGSGHLVKALHNGVQYAVMQAYAEGFALLEAHDGIDPVQSMAAWQNGSSIRSWLLSQMLAALEENPALDGVSSVVPDSGMGRWTALEAISLGVPTPVLTAALYARFHSQGAPRAEQLLRASRTQIGGQK